VPAAERETEPESEATARDRVAPITLTDMLLATADYISPEQASAPRSADIRADRKDDGKKSHEGADRGIKPRRTPSSVA